MKYAAFIFLAFTCLSTHVYAESCSIVIRWIAGTQTNEATGTGTTYAAQSASDGYYTNMTIYAFAATGWVSQTFGQYQTDTRSTTPSTDPLSHDVIASAKFDDTLIVTGPQGTGYTDYRFYTWEEYEGAAGPGGLSVQLYHGSTTTTQFDVEEVIGGVPGVDAYRIILYASRSNAVTFGTPFYYSMESQSYMPGDGGAFGTRLRTAVSLTEIIVRDADGNIVSNGYTILSYSGSHFPSTPPLSDLHETNGSITLYWYGYTGHTYSVEATTNSLADSWASASNSIIGTGSTNTAAFSMNDEAMRIFRIRKE
jgi:hypothetical protein